MELDPWILLAVNVACLSFTVAGASIIGAKGDKISGWYVYTVAATLGIIYFLLSGDPVQLAIWSFFLVNDLNAIRRKKKEESKEKK